ncbi:hypothetical protein ACFXMF_31690 [Embleya sp. NPDC059213]|uniref:hypothetical protein n=1 Tax=Embleya sp. NPDC059213 TaxID=3346771 RepID=UPI0036906883
MDPPKPDPPKKDPPAKPDSGQAGSVHPGAFCAPVGARGTTVKGTAMICSNKAGDIRARWRAA